MEMEAVVAGVYVWANRSPLGVLSWCCITARVGTNTIRSELDIRLPKKRIIQMEKNA
jgi:hypothetical protein